MPSPARARRKSPACPTCFSGNPRDGSRVTAFRTVFGYNHSYNGCPDNGKAPCLAKLDVIRRMAEEQDLPFQHYYGVGNHGGGPSIRELTLLTKACAEDGALRFASVRQYFDDAEAAGLTGRLPVVRDDLQHHASGCYAAHSSLKAANRRTENALLAAELYDALAAALLSFPPQREALKGAWEKALFNQFHDVLAGCCLREACDEALDSFAAARDAANDTAALAVQRLSWNIRTTDILDRSPCQKNGWKLWEKEGKGAPYVVFNPHSFPVSLPLTVNLTNTGVTDEQGRPLPVQTIRGPQTNGEDLFNMLFTAELPAFGYATYYLYQDHLFDLPAAEPAAAAGENYLENTRLRVEFDPASGGIVRFTDKAAGRDLAAGPMARALVMDDADSDTWAHGVSPLTTRPARSAKRNSGCWKTAGPRRPAGGQPVRLLHPDAGFLSFRRTGGVGRALPPGLARAAENREALLPGASGGAPRRLFPPLRLPHQRSERGGRAFP